MMGTIFTNMSIIIESNNQTSMSNLNNSLTTMLSNMPPMFVGQPYRNMSTAYGGMMGGTNTGTGTSGGGMMGRKNTLNNNIRTRAIPPPL
jgi:hypothetical protein